MIESALISIIYLLFCGMIGLTVINVALIITVVIILSKEQIRKIKDFSLICSRPIEFSTVRRKSQGLAIIAFI